MSQPLRSFLGTCTHVKPSGLIIDIIVLSNSVPVCQVSVNTALRYHIIRTHLELSLPWILGVHNLAKTWVTFLRIMNNKE